MSTEPKHSVTILSKVAGSLLVAALVGLFTGAISNRAKNTEQDTRIASLEVRMRATEAKQDDDHDAIAVQR